MGVLHTIKEEWKERITNTTCRIDDVNSKIEKVMLVINQGLAYDQTGQIQAARKEVNKFKREVEVWINKLNACIDFYQRIVDAERKMSKEEASNVFYENDMHVKYVEELKVY